MRFTECGEYRMLNQSTERDALPLPRTVTFWKPGYQGGGGGGGVGGLSGLHTTLADALRWQMQVKKEDRPKIRSKLIMDNFSGE